MPKVYDSNTYLNIHVFVNNLAYNEPRNTFGDIFKFYADRAIGKCIQLFLRVPSKLTNSLNKEPVLIITI